MEVSGQLRAPVAVISTQKPGAQSAGSNVDARGGPDISDRKPTRIRTPNLVARSQRTVPTRLAAETPTASLNKSRDNSSVGNISQSC
jgi:hypothetical protein